ncbi:hypothetical protein CLV33_10764 [Jejuia pallidilutea]|uniref:DUF1574 domain-containing protein n=1 Tax=Jejuia pallidilutea TaxID=504487 RepID=A0A362X1Q6_9FLAO|nr:hypothetical protein [Jejuia pallidilutea]PQV47282.1 hypothetical protein CLV33_10764 [Jejuia pallidilutea]
MKRFFKHIILFGLIFFTVEKVTWFLLDATPKRQYDKRLEKLINGEINKELIVLGSSKGAGNILANQLEEETGLSAYNLSYQGSNVNFHEFILKTLLKYNEKPEIILLAIDNPSEFVGDISIRYRVDVLQPLTNYNYINTTLIDEGVNNKLSHVFFLSRLNKSHFRFKNRTAPSMNPLDSSGTMPLIKKKDLELIYSKNKSSYNTALEESSRLTSFKNIQYLCKKNNIQLIHVFSPSYRSFNLSFFNRFKKLQKAEEGVIVFDTLKPEYKNADYFYDYAHLLENGAEIFTSEISAFINKNNTK